MKRISFEHYAMLLAYSASLRSEDPHRKVGAAAFNHGRRTIGTAYNGLASGKDVDDGFWADREARLPYVIHAEQNLITLFRQGECEIMAVTCYPCPSCATLICAAGVRKIIFGSVYSRDASSEASKIFDFYGVERQSVTYHDALTAAQLQHL